MSGKKLILLNLGWATLAVGTYFIGTSGGGDNAATAEGETAGMKSVQPVTSLGGKRDPGRASVTKALALESVGQARENQQLSDFFARIVTPENALSMLEEFEATPRSETSDLVFREFLKAWGKVAGPEAVSLVVKSTWTEPWEFRWGTKGSVESVMAGWASVDLAAAMEFTTQLREDTGFRGSTYKSTVLHLGILQVLERSNLDEAIAYSQQFYADTLSYWKAAGKYSYPDGDDRRGLEKVAAAVAEQRGLVGLEAWVAGLGGETPGSREYKAKATSRMLQAMRKKSTLLAAEWVSANADQGFVPASDLEATAEVFADTPEGQRDWIAARTRDATRDTLDQEIDEQP